MLFQDIFEDHLGHATLPSSQNILTLQIHPFKVRHWLPCHQEVPGALGKLGKVDNVVVGILAIYVDG